MSGGSYDYLCWTNPDKLLSGSHDAELKSMADRLIEFDAEDVAKETLELLQILKQCRTRIEVISQRLSDIWHEVEWCDSCDSSEDEVYKAIKKYRGEK